MPTRQGAARAPGGRDRRTARGAALRGEIAALRRTATGRNRTANNRTAQELVFAARGRAAPTRRERGFLNTNTSRARQRRAARRGRRRR